MILTLYSENESTCKRRLNGVFPPQMLIVALVLIYLFVCMYLYTYPNPKHYVNEFGLYPDSDPRVFAVNMTSPVDMLSRYV